jgi:hypothetical protein
VHCKWLQVLVHEFPAVSELCLTGWLMTLMFEWLLFV